MANFLEVYNAVELIENKGQKIICRGINVKNNKKVIIKLYKESEYNKDDLIKLKRNIKICRENNINNIIDVYSIGSATYNNSKYYTVEIEYIKGKSLKKIIKSETFEEIEALEMISQIINQLNVLEIENIEFKNLTTESVFLDKDGLIKLDFTEDIISKEDKNINVDYVYFLGKILYEMITKEEYDGSIEDIRKQIPSIGLYKILSKCLDENNKYNSIEDILADLDINEIINYNGEYINIDNIQEKKDKRIIRMVSACAIVGAMFTGSFISTIPIDVLLGTNKTKTTKVEVSTMSNNEESKATDNKDIDKVEESIIALDIKDSSDSNIEETNDNLSANETITSSNKNNSSNQNSSGSDSSSNTPSNNSSVTQKPNKNENESQNNSTTQKPETKPEQQKPSENKPEEVKPETKPEQNEPTQPEEVKPETKPEQNEPTQPEEVKPEIKPEDDIQPPVEDNTQTNTDEVL